MAEKINCVLCGEPLTEGKCANEHTFKKMCLNCKFMDDEMHCVNENNMQMMINKVKEVLGNSYTVDDIKLSPTILKEPTKKCKNWELSENVVEYLKTLFV